METEIVSTVEGQQKRVGYRAPEGYRSKDYPAFAVTVDVVWFAPIAGELSLPLVQRGNDPFEGHWALPGGFVEIGEDLLDAARRELGEETSSLLPDGTHIEQLGTYGAPLRDPRMRVVSVAHLALSNSAPSLVAGSDARCAQWVSLQDAFDLDLAFDHRQILHDAVGRLAGKLEYTTLAGKLLPKRFTLSQLRRVYETVWGVELDASNFRRKVRETPGFVIPVGETVLEGRGRPAEVYTCGEATMLTHVMSRGG